MVLLGGVQTMAGPVVGATLFTWLQDLIAREFQYWRATLGFTILVLVLVFPQGVAGSVLRFAKANRSHPLPQGEGRGEGGA
jgi:branched-chain amino acid transport system permease protein